MVAMCVYVLLYDVETFKRYSKFLTISMTISSIVFLVYPSCQELRPVKFPRDNLLTEAVKLLYRADTNTNVFPSEHAIGAIAVWIAAVHIKKLRSDGKLIILSIFLLLVCLSTVFLKQHSILDVIAAVPICMLSFWLCYHKRTRQ